MYSMLTRSQRISHENLRLRDKAWLEGFERWFAERAGLQRRRMCRRRRRCSRPTRCASVTLKNRVVVSPMAQYSCVDGLPGDYHLVHLGARALGGAGMVMAEMTCPSRRRAHHARLPGAVERGADATPGSASSTTCTARRDAKIALQLGHAGPKGSTNAPWDGDGRRRAAARGQLAADRARRAVPYSRRRPVPRAMTRADMDRVTRRLRRADAPCRRGRLRLAGTALRARLPAEQLHLAADQPAQRRLRRQPGQPAALPAGGVRRDARGLAEAPADVGAHLGARLGRRRQHAGRRGADRPRCSRPRAPT